MGIVAADRRAIDKLIQKLAQTKDHQAGPSARMAQLMGAQAIKFIADEFRTSTDPYGKPWKPVHRNRKRDRTARARRLKAGKPIRGDKPLIDTGRLRAAATAQQANASTGSTVRVFIPVQYASYLQNGTTRRSAGKIVYKGKALHFQEAKDHHMEARMIVPPEGKRLPARWTQAFSKICKSVVRKHFGKGK